MDFHNILCPIDFADHSEKIIRVALKMAEAGGTITLFHHSVLIAPIQSPDVPLGFEADKELLDYAQKKLDEVATNLKKVNPTINFKTHHSYQQSLTDSITELVDKNKMDLIVMGTHGRTGIGRLLMGSVAEDVLRHASCPVFLIKV